MSGDEVGQSPPPEDEHESLSSALKENENANPELKASLAEAAVEDTDAAKPQLSIERQASRTSGLDLASGTDGMGPDQAARSTVTEAEGLVVLDEAVDDGTMVKTAGTLFFTSLQVKRSLWYVD